MAVECSIEISYIRLEQRSSNTPNFNLISSNLQTMFNWFFSLINATYVLILTLSFIFGAVPLVGQSGISCANARSINLNNVITDTSTTSSLWYSFVATDTATIVVLHNLSDTAVGHLHELRLYSDSCANLQLLGVAYARNDSATITFGYSDSLAIRTSELIVGRTYYIKIDREASQFTTCRTCSNYSNSPLAFSLSVLPSVTANSISFSGNQCILPGCITDQSGSLSVSNNGTYRIQVTQSGPYSYFGNILSWVVLVDNNNASNTIYAVDASGNSLSFSLSNGTSYTIYLNGRVACNALGGQTDIFTFVLQRQNILNNWNSVASTNYSRSICESALPASATICAGGSITLIAVQTSGPYAWAPSSSLSCATCQSPIATPSVTTTYTLSVANPNTCCPVIQDQVTVIVDAPTAYFTAVNEQCVGIPVLFFNNSTGGQYYYWDFGDGTSSTANNPAHTYSQPGQYNVTLLVNSGTCGTQYTHVVCVTPSIGTYNKNCCSSLEQYIYNGSIHLQNQNDVNSFLASFTNNTWVSNFVTIRDTLFIENNLSVNLTGRTIGFGPWGKIIVTRGSQLTLDNCFLLPAGSTHDVPKPCPVMWQGIEVWGDASVNQVSPLQGRLIVKNNTIIRDAHNAIISGRWNGVQFLNAYGGGVVQISSGCQFINNAYGVRFTPYPFVSQSRIQNSSFLGGGPADPGYNSANIYTYPNQYNGNYAQANANQRAYAYIQTIGIRHLRIEGNTFDNAEYGIIGINSTLRVGGSNTALGNTFSNIANGEVHGNFFNSAFYNNRIESNTYVQNQIPVQSWNGLGDRIVGNDITSGAFVGIASVSSRSITINDNLIGGPIAGCLLGVSVSNTGSTGGLIGYSATGNIFTSCVNGVWAHGNNPALQIRCNTHVNPSGNGYARNWANFNVLANQGNLPILNHKYPAGNRFTQFSPLRNQIYSTSLFDYYSHSADPAGNPVTVIPTTSAIAGNILTSGNIINTGIQQTSTSCDPGPLPPVNAASLDAADLVVEVLETEKTAIQIQIDGGQTQYLLNAINSNMGSAQLKQLLINNSPLSDTVLISYINKIGTPPGLFKDVVIVNSPVSQIVRPILTNKTSTLPPGIAAQILSAQNSQNRTLSVVDAELASAINRRQVIYNQHQEYYSEQYVIDSIYLDSIHTLLTRENSHDAKVALVAIYIVEKQFSNAGSILNTLNPQSDAETAEKDLLSMLLLLYSSGRDVFSMNSAEIQIVRDISTLPYDCSARASARVILFTAFGEPLIFEFDGNENRSSSASNISDSTLADNLSDPFPNPAATEVNFICSSAENSSSTINVYDASGKLVFSSALPGHRTIVSINTKNWSAGIYCAVIVSEAEVVQRKNFVVNNKP